MNSSPTHTIESLPARKAAAALDESAFRILLMPLTHGPKLTSVPFYIMEKLETAVTVLGKVSSNLGRS